MSDATERRWTVEQAATTLGCHPETLRRAIRSGELRANRDGLAVGRPLLIRDGDLKAFISARRGE